VGIEMDKVTSISLLGLEPLKTGCSLGWVFSEDADSSLCCRLGFLTPAG
jgi:hypothetical protein